MHITLFYLFSSSVTNITLITLITLILLTWWALWVCWAPWFNLCKRCLLVVLHYQYYLYYMYRMRLFVQSLYYHITGITRLPFPQKHWFYALGLAISMKRGTGIAWKMGKEPLMKEEWTWMEFGFDLNTIEITSRILDAIRSHWFPYLLVPANKH